MPPLSFLFREDVMVDIERIKNDFAQLVSYDSVSFSERNTGDWIIARLKTLGFEVEEDDAGRHYGGNCGNIYGFLKGNIPGDPILFSAHMDVVEPGIGKTAIILEDGKITSSKDTVLGADDICGILGILEGISSVLQDNRPHRDVEVLFAIGEEVYGKGAKLFDYSKIKAKDVYVLDMSGEVGSAAVQAPSIVSFDIMVKGAASHAGFAPEKGINAIAAMSALIADTVQGHIDEDTTLNIGTITGGRATNIVSELCKCSGEIRSYSHKKAMQCLENLQTSLNKLSEERGVSVSLEKEVHLEAYRTAEDESVVIRFKKACEKLGLPGETVSTFGGSDNNIYVRQGLHGIVLSCGMFQVHSVEEYTTVDELEKCARLVAELVCDL